MDQKNLIKALSGLGIKTYRKNSGELVTKRSDIQKALKAIAKRKVIAHEEWKIKAKDALEKQLELETNYRDYGEIHSDMMHLEVATGEASNNGESKWIVFQDHDAAERYCVKYIEDKLENDPTALAITFPKSFLEKHYYVKDEDKKNIAYQESSSHYANMESEDILKEAGIEISEDTDIVTEAEGIEEQLILDKAAEIETLLNDDPVKYAKDMGYDKLSEVTWLSINVRKAAEDAITENGVDKYLDNYDGAVVDLGTAEAYGRE